MSERLLRELAARLRAGEATVLASIVDSRGATPRRCGSRMLIGGSGQSGSIGGGEAEARVLALAERMLADGADSASLQLKLDGSAQAAGICGGRMAIALHRWTASELTRVETLLARLAAGEPVELSAAELGLASEAGVDDASIGAAGCIEPDPLLLICGAGHCGQALLELARPLDYQLAVHDPRAELLEACTGKGVQCWPGPAERLIEALDSNRQRLVVLLNRDYPTDIAQLRMLAALPDERQPQWIGLMGSRRRLATVRAELIDSGLDWTSVHAPVGLDIGAQTPHEIAISILAQLIEWRCRVGLKGQV